ncbi:MAG: DUF4337 family protein [Verrucomicrobia bacterium]|nr:DUF4337 family protein [Verrucomicrobiota bacterium]
MAGLPKIKLKAEIPEELKAELAPTKWGKILSVTPVVLTVIATMLAGLSSSEMTRAQYDRSLAAQRQSKAGDQWSFFQGKRLRAVVLRTTLDQMMITQAMRSLDLAALRQALAGSAAAPGIETPAGQEALAAMREGRLPKFTAPAFPAAVQAALAALEASKPDAEVARLLTEITSGPLDEALRTAQGHALALDEHFRGLSQVVDACERQLATISGDGALRRDFVAARMQYNALRYDAEARVNQTIAELYELQVRASNLSAERHHRRSSRFFYGMLAAQLGVIVSTLAMAAQKRNLLWGIAAAAGGIALAFTVYVLLYV